MNMLILLLGLGAAHVSAAPPRQPTHAAALLPACPRDSSGTPVTENGITRSGTPARRYVESFLSGDPHGVARVHTGTTYVDPASLRILQDSTDNAACSSLNGFISNGASQSPSAPWVYFTAGGFYFAARWTNPQPLSSYTLGHAAVMVFDSSLNLVGAWTA